MNITRRLRGSSIPGAVLLVAGVLASYVFLSAQFALAFPASPQQAGAVPLSQGIADVAAQLAKSIPEGQTMTVAVTDFPDLSGRVAASVDTRRNGLAHYCLNTRNATSSSGGGSIWFCKN